jgi:hypothetical protein
VLTPERAKQNRSTSSPNSVKHWKQCNFCKSAVTRDESFSRHFTRSLDQNWTKIAPRKRRSRRVECPVQVSPSKSSGARSCSRRPVLLRRVQIGGTHWPRPTLVDGANLTGVAVAASRRDSGLGHRHLRRSCRDGGPPFPSRLGGERFASALDLARLLGRAEMTPPRLAACHGR